MTQPPDVEARHLRALLAVAAEGTFTDAAIALGTTQASASRTVAQLERLVGRTLVERTNRGATLTPAGSEVAQRAAVLLAGLEELRAGGPARRLTVGCPWSGFGARTAAVHAAWDAAAPGVDLAIRQVDTPTGGVAEGRADVALLRGEPPAELASSLVGHEPRLAALGRAHPLARRRRIRLGDLAAYPVAVNRRTGTTGEALFAGAAGPVRTLDTLDTDHWLDTIGRGEAVGITSSATREHYAAPDVRFVPLLDAPDLPVHLAWRRGAAHPLLGTLVAAVRAVYGSPQPPG